jgi:ATP:ADP antiporter, AAA family
VTTAAPARDTPLRRLAERTFGIEAALAEPVVAGAAMFFLVFASYFMLRPVRETMGVAGGVSNLPWLFTATFVATLVAVPLFGWLAGRVQRRRILAWTYAFFVSNLVLFAAAFAVQPETL